MTKKFMKNCSTSILIGKVKSRSSVRYHLTLVKRDPKDTIANAGQDAQEGTVFYTLAGNIKQHSHYGKQPVVSSKTPQMKRPFAHHPTGGYISKECGPGDQRDSCKLVVFGTLLTTDKIRNQFGHPSMDK
jgi:hypothetical protein